MTRDVQPAVAELSTEPVGYFYTWWRGDPLPPLPMPLQLAVQPIPGDRLDGALPGVDDQEVRRRLERGHRPWQARVGAVPVAWGWVATEEASIGQLGVTFPIPKHDRYLWDFLTLPEWRGRGIYPAMLQAIIRNDPGGERFWVGHDLANQASARGILKAGFRRVGAAYLTANGSLVYAPLGDDGLGEVAAKLLQLPLIDPSSVSPSSHAKQA